MTADNYTIVLTNENNYLYGLILDFVNGVIIVNIY